MLFVTAVLCICCYQ